MKLDELRAALVESVKRGTMGVPVALRVCVQFSEHDADLRAGWRIALDIARSGLPNLRPIRLHAQRSAAQDGELVREQLSVLVSCQRGETLSVTIGSSGAARSSLDLLLVGNRGVVRLEGGELFDPGQRTSTPPKGASPDQWWHAVEQSLREQGAVELGD